MPKILISTSLGIQNINNSKPSVVKLWSKKFIATHFQI